MIYYDTQGVIRGRDRMLCRQVAGMATLVSYMELATCVIEGRKELDPPSCIYLSTLT